MTTVEQLETPTLARKLGEVAHVSPLLRKAVRISGSGSERVGQWLLKCAVLRGASHYARAFDKELPPDSPDLSDEEVGVALCLGQHPYNSAFIRAAAQLLSSPRIDPARLARLAVMERTEPVLLHIANSAARVALGAQPWASLRTHLSQRRTSLPDVLPHWSRFVSQTGVTPFGGGPEIKWLWRLDRQS
jgi:hypothetical protein